MSNTTIRKTVFFAASRETVWAFLTEKEKLAQWFHPIKADLEEHEDYSFFKKNKDAEDVKLVWGKVLKMDAPTELIYTFIVDPFNDAETTVSWLLEDAAGGTRLSLTHAGIAEAAESAALQMLLDLDKGWNEHLAELNELAEQ